MKKQRRAKGSRKQSAAKGVRRGATALAGVPTEALAAELKRRRSELPRLEKAARELRTRLAEVEARIAALGGAVQAAATAEAPRSAGDAAHAAGFRAVRGGKPTMAAHILGHLRGAGGAQSRGQILSAMASATGRGMSPSLSVQVSAILRKLVNAGEARQVGRGLYAAKDAVHASAE